MSRTALALVLVAAAAGGACALDAGDVEQAVGAAARGLGATVRLLASDREQGRDNDTPESLRAQSKLVRALRRVAQSPYPGARGLEAFKQHFTVATSFGPLVGTNLLAVIPGRELPDEYLMVGVHYDHLGTRSTPNGACSARGAPGGAVCNGATDNATGVAEVLAIGRAIKRLPTPPRRSVVLALWDAEEDGLRGSLYYVGHPVLPLARTRAYVNFDIQGSDLLPSLARTSFAVGGETGGATLRTIVAGAVAAEGLHTLPLSYIFGQLRSDYASLVGVNVPTIFFSDSTNGCYHTTMDDVGVVDWKKLETQSRIAFRVAVALAETQTPPAFVPPNPALATYADALALQQVFHAAAPDLSLFPPADRQAELDVRDAIDGIVAGGPAAFDSADVGTLLTAALNGIAAIQRLGCRTP